MNNKPESPPSPASSDTSTEHEFAQYKNPKPIFLKGAKEAFPSRGNILQRSF
jgi:hypothetical protein